MQETNIGGGDCRYKRIVQVGSNSIIGDEPISVLQFKVLCNRTALIEINRCMRCEYNDGLLNQYLMRCTRPVDGELPDTLETDVDY